jgi:hypothetical protein
MAMTPEQWLPILSARLDARMPRIARLRRYANGDADLPEMGKNTKDSWAAFQKKARKNVAGLVCSSLAGRTVPNGVRVGTSTTGPAVDALKLLWRDNRLPIVFADALWNMFSVSVGYLVDGTRDGDPIITSEPPEKVITAPDPVQPWRARAALMAWRDDDSKKDYANVWVPGLRQRFVRDSKTESGTLRGTIVGDWEIDGDPEVFTGGIPVYALENFGGMSEFEAHLDAIDAINLGKLQRLVVTALQAFKARALTGGLPETDEEGNEVDWAKRIVFGAGSIVDLPEGVNVWESQATDITPLLSGEKADLRDLAAIMQVPLDVFLPEGANQSGTGAANAHKGEIQKAKDRIIRATAPMEASLVNALRVLGLDNGATVQLTWEPPEHVSLSEKAAAAVQAKAAGKTQRWIDENIWGMSPDEILAEDTERAVEQLQLITLTGAGDGGS